MERVRRPSVRLWQTELFVIVIVVAMLILSVSLSQGLQRTLTTLGESEQLSNTSALASRLGSEFPLTPASKARLDAAIQQYRLIYGDDVWVYAADGTTVTAAHLGGPTASVLARAKKVGFANNPPFTAMNLVRNGYVMAGTAIYAANGSKAGTLVTANSVQNSLAVLDSVRGRLWTTFWVALIVAGLLGFAFSEFIGRRVRRMTKAASAIAGGDFEQRLPAGLVPDEIYDLAQSYNRMAVQLGEVFGELREREQEIAAVVESMGEGVVAFDEHGEVRIVNPIALEFLGVAEERERLIGRPMAEMTDNAEVLALVSAGLGGSNASAVADIGERTILLHATPTQAEAADTPQAAPPEAPGAVLLMADITEQKRLEEAQRNFVANASHEMRTPISALKGLLELLDSGAKDDVEVRDDFLRTMSLEVDRLGRLVADLLTLAQLESGGLVLRREPVPAGELLNEVATVMRPLADRSGVRLVTDTSGPAEEVLADRDRIAQVLLGFVDNALKHSKDGDTVTMMALSHGDSVTLAVADEGPGMNPEVVPHLFDRFYRIDEARSTGGTGLGLAIAKEIVEAHGSSIEVDTAPGEGATFRFDLPAAT